MFRAPSQAQLPHLSTLLDDLPETPRQIARHLGISEATLRKYRKQGQAPQAIMLALFWESSWGRMTADVNASNYASLQAQLANAYKRENLRLRGQIKRLEIELANSKTAAANSPIFRIG